MTQSATAALNSKPRRAASAGRTGRSRRLAQDVRQPAILDALATAGRSLPVAGILRLLQAQGLLVNLTTLYRDLRQLHEAGRIVRDLTVIDGRPASCFRLPAGAASTASPALRPGAIVVPGPAAATGALPALTCSPARGAQYAVRYDRARIVPQP